MLNVPKPTKNASWVEGSAQAMMSRLIANAPPPGGARKICVLGHSWRYSDYQRGVSSYCSTPVFTIVTVVIVLIAIAMSIVLIITINYHYCYY